MTSAAISNGMPPVSVEYDVAQGKRRAKEFKDANEAKRFYAAKHKAGKNPSVKGEHAKAITAAANGKAPAKPAKAKKEPKEVAARDRFTNRIGTQAAEINTLLGTKPITAATVAEKTGFGVGRIHGHFKFLLDRGFIAKTAEGYAVKKAKAK